MMASPKRPRTEPDDLDPEIFGDNSFAKHGLLFNTECDLETDAELTESPQHAILFERPAEQEKVNTECCLHADDVISGS